MYVFNDYRLGVGVGEDGLADVTALVGSGVPKLDRMTELITLWDDVAGEVRRAANREADYALCDVMIRPPQPRPRTIVAAPVNYLRHQAEMGGEAGIYPGYEVQTIESYAGFIKASSSVVGPDGAIELRMTDRRVDHEAEVGVVIGRPASRVPRETALEYIFGYVPLLDITLRGPEDRSFRKSFDTFTPIGPAIVTADEVPDATKIAFWLSVNGEKRQQSTTEHLIFDIAQLIELYSGAMTLQPGDLIATGTPEGVGPIVPGDRIDLWIDNVGHLSIPVRAG